MVDEIKGSVLLAGILSKDCDFVGVCIAIHIRTQDFEMCGSI